MNIQFGFSRLILVSLLIVSSISTNFGKIYHLKIPSVALVDSNRVIVSTPANYDPNKKNGYPFIVMLHGWSGDETQWEDDADLQLLCDTHNILLVLPDGGYDGWWIDTQLVSGRNYGTHLHEEIKSWIIENFNGSSKTAQHGIMGLSMGGFGALNQILKHPDSYVAAASLSGVMDITRHTENWHLSNALGLYSDEPKRWKANNPQHLLQKTAPQNSPPVLLICGRDDFAFTENQVIAKQMKQFGYSTTLQEEDGAHNHIFWKTHVASAIEFIVSNFPE